MNCLRNCSAAAFAFALIAHSALAVTIPTVPVGDAGNGNDPGNGNRYGAVSYDYNIAKFEVTIGQYAEFLNAVAKTDTYGLYSINMATNANTAGIAQAGMSGNYLYVVIGTANRPITYVSWGDAARFANWMHNGQPMGAQNASTTEDGAYTLNGKTSDIDLTDITRNANAKWAIPTENEWYKAAYWQSQAAGGDLDNYWFYPFKTNNVPYSAMPPGNAAPDNTRVGNFNQDDFMANGYNDGFAVTGSTSQSVNQNYLTEVGAYTAAPNFFGMFDMGGNVFEWNEGKPTASSRGYRGGSWGLDAGNSRSTSSFFGSGPATKLGAVGFRLVSVPEPSTTMLACTACAMWFLRKRGCRRRTA